MKPFGRRLEQAPPEEIVAQPRPVAAIAVASASDVGMQLRLRAKIMERLDSAAIAQMAPDVLRAELEPVIHQIVGQERIQFSARDQDQLAQELTDDMVGFGPLEPLLRDDSISDIMVNGPDTVFIEVRGKLQKSTVRFRDAEHAAMVAQKMVATIGRRIDESSPLCDARLSAAGARRPLHLDPQVLQEEDRLRRHDSERQHDPRRRAPAGDRGAMPHEYPDLRRHGLRQDHAAERPEPHDLA
jgi:pilus assembly protein CpaF